MKYRGIIVGGGIVGSAVAYELARRGVTDLLVLDAQSEAAWNRAGLQYSGVRHLWTNRVNMDLARCSMGLFSEFAEQIRFQRHGFLRVFAEDQKSQADATLARALQNGLAYEPLSASLIRDRYPFLQIEDKDSGIFGPRDGSLDAVALRKFYRLNASATGVQFLQEAKVSDFEEGAGGANVQALIAQNQTTYEADFVVLCTGAQTRSLLQAKLPSPEMETVSRQIHILESKTDLSAFGTVIDSGLVSWRGCQNEAIAEWSGPAKKSEAMKLREAAGMKPKRTESVEDNETPDGTAILGKLPGYKRILEAHSFAGRGIVQSYGAAVAVADLVIEGKYIHLEADALTRERFAAPRQTWLLESLYL